MVKNGMRPIHPGEILKEEFINPSEPPLNANTLAKALGVPANRVTAIIKGQLNCHTWHRKENGISH